MYGLRRPWIPKREVVESEIQPITGSVMTSKDRANAVKKDKNASPAPIFTARNARTIKFCDVLTWLLGAHLLSASSDARLGGVTTTTLQIM